MLNKLKEFIHSDKVYSQCTNEEKRAIDITLKNIENMLQDNELLACENEHLHKEKERYKNENEHLIDRIYRLETNK